MYRPDIENGDISYRANIYMAAFLIVAYLVLWRFDQGFFFFWDSVENASILAHSYYENGFNISTFLNDIHAGQFPLFGLYLSALWQIAGRTLEVSHFAVVPFHILNAWLIWKIGTRHFNFYGGMLFVIMMLVQPTYLSHSILISPKVVVLTAFFIGLYGIESKRKILLWISSAILIMSNDMGYLFLFGILMWLLFRYYYGDRSKQMKSLLIPVIIVSTVGLIFWFFYGVQNDFRQIIFFDRDSFLAIIQTMGNRLLELHIMLWDFGMFIFYVMIVLLYYMHDSIDRERFRYWIFLFISLYLVVFFHALLLDNPGSHAFYLPVHFSVIALYMSMVAERIEIRQFGWNIVIALLVILSANFWIYPDGYDQEWSSNISHIPYYEVRKDMNEYLRKHDIKYNEVGAAFPNTFSSRYIDLDTTDNKMKLFNLKEDRYILYSNVFNTFSEEDRKQLQDSGKFKLIHEESLTNIFMKLYEKSKTE